jgi:hypothetical protein
VIKKVLATAAVVVSAAGVAATPAMATGHHRGGESGNGAGSAQVYGNTHTGGYMSPQIGLIQGSFNKPCIAVPLKHLGDPVAPIGNGPIPVHIEDVLNQSQNQQCTENSVQHAGDAPLAHLLSDIVSHNGAGNG